MRRKISLVLHPAFVAADLVALWLSLAAGAYGTQAAVGVSYFEILAMRFSVGNLLGILILTLSWVGFRYTRGTYRFNKQMQWETEIKQTVLDSVMAAVFLSAIALLFEIKLFSPAFMRVFCMTFVLLMLILRPLAYLLYRYLDPFDKYLPQVLVVGTGEAAWAYANYLTHDRSRHADLVGFVDDEVHLRRDGMNYLGTLDDLPQVLKDHVIDEIVVALPLATFSQRVGKIIDLARESGVSIRFTMYQLLRGVAIPVGRVRSEAVKWEDGNVDHDLIFDPGYGTGWQVMTKRLIDVFFSLIGLLATSPLLLIAVAGVFLTMGRPIFFAQDRLGYHGRRFKVYKIRTMIPDADAQQDKLMAHNERGGPAFKMTRDPRITPLGHLLRKTNIDELPQLLNILKGDMSLVGPRPLPLNDYRRMGDKTYRRRLSVLPGLTGSWQISDRDNVSFEEWMNMDVEYIDSWSLWSDLSIIFMTIPVVIKGRGSK